MIDVTLPPLKSGTHHGDPLLSELYRFCLRRRVPLDSVRGPSRRAELVRVRALFSIRAYRRGYDTVQIGAVLNRHPSTINHLINHYEP